MSDNDRSSWGGCLLLLACSVVVAICGGGGTIFLAGLYYAQEARQAEMEARARALQMGERPLPPGSHAVAIGPEGELFWDDEPIDMAGLEERLESIPPQERETTGIVIRPGIGAPQQVVDQVLALSEDFDEVVEPLPLSLLRDAPAPAGESQPPSRRQTK